MNDSTPEFLKRLRKFVQAEADAQYRALEKQWSHPLQERVARGWAIEGLHIGQMKDGIIRVANEVAGLVKQGLPKKHLLLLHSDGRGVNNLIQAIDDRLGKNAALDPKDNYPGDYVRVTTINAGAGLESPIVFLVGLRSLFEQEQSLRLSDEEREELIRDNTRKLYMAATRAGQRLVLTYSGELPDVLKSALEMKTSLA